MAFEDWAVLLIWLMFGAIAGMLYALRRIFLLEKKIVSLEKVILRLEKSQLKMEKAQLTAIGKLRKKKRK